MELTTFLGMIFGFICVCIGIALNGSVLDFLHLPSFFIVFGGVAAATLVSYPLSMLRRVFKLVVLTFRRSDARLSDDIDNIISLANIARRKGVLALEDEIANSDDEFLKKGVMLVVDGTDPQVVRNVMETELALLDERHQQGQSILGSMSSYSPAFGMIGTLIGLINMLGTLDDPSALGPGMSTALITTFYGVLLANLIFTPMMKKLQSRSADERLQKEILLEGILSIQDGENPRIIREKLSAFLSRSQLQSIEAGKQATGQEETVQADDQVNAG